MGWCGMPRLAGEEGDRDGEEAASDHRPGEGARLVGPEPQGLSVPHEAVEQVGLHVEAGPDVAVEVEDLCVLVHGTGSLVVGVSEGSAPPVSRGRSGGLAPALWQAITL